jgi:hypothetical protein
MDSTMTTLVIGLILLAVYCTYLLNRIKFLGTQLVVAHVMIKAMAKDLHDLGHPMIVLGKLNDKNS